MKQGVDISGANTITSWSKIKENSEFIILKLGNIYDEDENYIDSKFVTNYNNAIKNGLKVGVYVYNYCNSLEKLKEGTNWVVSQLKGKDITLPVFLDMEDSTIAKEGKEALTNQCKEFSKIIQNSGFKAGVYANASWFKIYLDKSKFYKDTFIWIAQYKVKVPQIDNYDLWQYTSLGTLSGIKGNVDINYLKNENLLSIKNESSNTNVTTKKYTTGRYEVTCSVLTVRTGAGTNYSWKKFSELTQNAQSQIVKLSGYKPNGLCKRSYL